VNDGFTGTVTPSNGTILFTPASRDYSNVVAPVAGADYSPTFVSQGGRDGWVLESAQGSGIGGSMDSAAATFQLGDDAFNRQYRAILSFDTSALPDTAVITSATLSIKQKGAAVGANPFTALGKLKVDIRKGSFGGSPLLQTADFSAAPTLSSAATIGKVPVSGWYSGALGAPALGDVNVTGSTQLRLHFAIPTSANGAAGYMKFASGSGAAGSRPALAITYTVP
jgi:hypothetical protein